MKFIEWFFSAGKYDVSSLILRVTLGVVIFAHWAQKMFWWFWGGGFEASVNWLTEGLGLPYLIVILVILGESLWALALVFGFMSRFMAMGIFVIMFGAMFYHLDAGFFIDWYSAGKGNWIEFHLLSIWMAAALMIRWGGALSVDLGIYRWVKGD